MERWFYRLLDRIFGRQIEKLMERRAEGIDRT